MEEKKKDYIFNNIGSVIGIGGGESSKVYTITTIKTGETEIVIEKTISKRFPITEYEKAMDLYDNVNGGGYIIELEDLRDIKKKGQCNK